MRNYSSRILLAAFMAISFALTTTTSWAQWIQTATLTASDGQQDDFFSVATAIDGDTLVLGAFGHNQLAGSAYVFTESNGVWTQVAELTASDAIPGLAFGTSVAISGHTIVVGANACCTFDSNGAVYVFVKPATGWTNMTQTAELTESSPLRTNMFGGSVAISGDTIVAGAEQRQVGSNFDQGVAYVFVKPAHGWTNATPTATLTASDGASNDHLGTAVAIRGSTIAAGAILFNHPDGQGAIYVFGKPASGWANENETAKLTATDPNSAAFLGSSLAISADEATIVAGAPRRQVSAPPIPNGAAYIYSKPASGWQSATQTSELLAPGPSQFFGSGVAINGPGTIIAVGAPSTSTRAGLSLGAAYVYRKPATGWAPTPQANAKLNPPNPERNGNFGDRVAVRARTVVVGEGGATVNGITNQGAAYIFDRP
jgi:hypothetical protein